MSRTKIAPTLVMVDRRKLRAQDAVIRAAERMLPQAKTPTKLLAWTFRAADVRALDRALARLRRVSGGAVKGNRKLPANSRRASPGGAEGGGR